MKDIIYYDLFQSETIDENNRLSTSIRVMKSNEKNHDFFIWHRLVSYENNIINFDSTCRRK